jgi:hypothetical protein
MLANEQQHRMLGYYGGLTRVIPTTLNLTHLPLLLMRQRSQDIALGAPARPGAPAPVAPVCPGDRALAAPAAPAAPAAAGPGRDWWPSLANSSCEGRPTRRFGPLHGPFGGIRRCRTSSCSQATTFSSVTRKPSPKSRRANQSYLQTD